MQLGQVASVTPGTVLGEYDRYNMTRMLTLSANISLLQKITQPAYFADFHSSMLAAYEAVKTACAALTAATSSSDTSLLSTARQSLNDAVDHFNANDKLGTSLMQSYYAQ